MRGSGRIVSRDFDLSGFTAIDAARFDIEVAQSDTFKVSVRADDNVIDRLIVRTSGGTLLLHTRPFHWLTGRLTLEATIHMPSLTAITLSGSATAGVRSFGGIDRLDLELSGASDLRGKVDAATVDIVANGASRVSLAGSAGRVTIEASGASKVGLGKLATGTAAVELSGASRATLNVADTIESVEASGASRLRYAGDPTIGYLETSGASRVARV